MRKKVGEYESNLCSNHFGALFKIGTTLSTRELLRKIGLAKYGARLKSYYKL
jgi:hypothetical protein